MNRVLWDPSLDHAEFTVGYEDRFRGMLEKPLVSFKKARLRSLCLAAPRARELAASGRVPVSLTRSFAPRAAQDKTDDEFIPFHRIWYFKRNGDIVWDREKRIDRVFSIN
jgi:uncharacterized protein (UPF0248 family)